MTGAIELEFLGTGTSTGVPLIGCDCKVCRSADPRNRRLRSSAVIRAGGLVLLVDSGPDLRQQALERGLTAVDAVIYTHGHLDHVTGFDDLRAFCWYREGKLPLYGTEETLGTLRKMFGWAFSPKNNYQGYVRPDAREVGGAIRLMKHTPEDGSPVCLEIPPEVRPESVTREVVTVTPVPVRHGNVGTVGYVFEACGKRVGYVPDVKDMPESSEEMLRGLDALAVDALRDVDHPTHMTIGEALELMARLEPKAGYLTHMSHDVDYEALRARLPGHIEPAYDGLKVVV